MGICSMCGEEESRLIGGICTVCMQLHNMEIAGEEDILINGIEEEHMQGSSGGTLFELASLKAAERMQAKYGPKPKSRRRKKR